MIGLTLNNLTTNRKYTNAFFEKIFKASVKETHIKSKNIELSINLVGEARIKALNKKYLGKDKATDVLSFPLNEVPGVKLYGNDIMSLGDIFICLPVAKKYAKQEGVSLDCKLTFLTVHGFLHLLGHDHDRTALQEKKMFALQDKILDSLGF